MLMAVCPVTAIVASPAWSRIWATRSVVSGVLGPLAGTTVNNAVSPAGLSRGGVTAATLSSARTVFVTASACAASATTSSGPLKPGPKPSASRS
jgi:hypothetical protein